MRPNPSPTICIIAEKGATVNVFPTPAKPIGSPEDTSILGRYAQHKQIAEKINRKLAAVYRQRGEVKKAGNLLTCGGYLNMRTYHDAGHTMRLSAANFCKHPLCLMCAWRRSVKWGQRLTTAVKNLYLDDPDTNLYHLVLTQPNTKTITNDQIKNLKKQAVAFIREYYKTGSYVMSLEITCKKNGYHPHLHCFIDTGHKAVDTSLAGVDALRRAWRQYMPSAYSYTIAGVFCIKDLDRAASELCKYILSTDGSATYGANLADLAAAIKSVRQQSAAGRLNKYLQAAKEAIEIGLAAELDKLESYGYTDTLYRWMSGLYAPIAERTTSDDPALNDDDWIVDEENECSALYNPIFGRGRNDND